MSEYKKSLLIEALRSYVSAQELELILRRWEATHATKSLYELNAFLAAMSDIPSVIQNRSQIYRTIIKRLHISEADATEAATQPEREQIVLSAETKLAVNQVVITGDLINEILAEINFEEAQSVCKEVSNTLSQDRQLKPILSWVSVVHAKLHVDKKNLLTTRQCQSLINTFYASLCEVIGPINADRTLSASIDTVSRSHRRTEGAEHLLQQLLNH